jgi:hypothetical protein
MLVPRRLLLLLLLPLLLNLLWTADLLLTPKSLLPNCRQDRGFWSCASASMTGSTGSSAVEALSADFLDPRAGRMLVEDFLGTAAFWRERSSWDPSLWRWTLWLSVRGSGALGSASEVYISSVMSRVRWWRTGHMLVIAREEHFAAIVKQEIEYGERRRFQIRVSTLSSTYDWSPGGDRESSVAGTFNSRPFTPVRI